MHGLKDLDDLDRRKADRIIFSRRAEEEKKETLEREAHLFNNIIPPEDFLRPDDTTSPRSTGYERGHIRALLKVDTFGPVSSSVTALERSLGMIPPHSPNIDRYRSEGGSVSLGSKGSSRLNSHMNRTERSISTAGNSTHSFNTIRGLFHETSYVRPDDLSLSVADHTLNPPKSGKDILVDYS